MAQAMSLRALARNTLNVPIHRAIWRYDRRTEEPPLLSQRQRGRLVCLDTRPSPRSRCLTFKPYGRVYTGTETCGGQGPTGGLPKPISVTIDSSRGPSQELQATVDILTTTGLGLAPPALPAGCVREGVPEPGQNKEKEHAGGGGEGGLPSQVSELYAGELSGGRSYVCRLNEEHERV